MESSTGGDWKKDVGFPINYSPESSDDDYDQDVVLRSPRQTDVLLADCGDGTEADMLGTTPPRTRIRQKNIHRRNFLDPSSPAVQRILNSRRDVIDHAHSLEHATTDKAGYKKRCVAKQLRARERDSKQDMEHDIRCDSNPMPAVATLVDTCSRFMSLTSRPKHRESPRADKTGPSEPDERGLCEGDELPASRVNFHKTFSLLINMGNIEKGCKRAISREEQVWQNELKDLIWLELQARLAGRGLPQQDAHLCALRNVVPRLIADIMDYKFVSTSQCRLSAQKSEATRQDDSAADQFGERVGDGAENQIVGCVSFDCQECVDAIGKAMREVGSLLDSFYNAISLYPSRRSMTSDHPLIATAPFNNRIKAMCMWYNTALHLRLQMLGMRRMLRSIKRKSRATHPHRTDHRSDTARQSSESHRPCQVRFNVSNTPSDSNNSDSSGQSDAVKELDGETKETEELKKEEIGQDEADSRQNGPTTPEIVISEQYGTNDTSISTESGYTSMGEASPAGEAADTFDVGACTELAQIQLLNKCDVSLYRGYHREILKTQGVRRCMNFICKMRTNLLDKVYLTLEKPECAQSESCIEEEPAEVFNEPKQEADRLRHDAEEEIKNYELRRYGCWSEECLSMRLPSYRSHFLLLSCVSMDAVHDYLALRLEARPERPSCLTVKQLIHELREGLDISSEMRANFVRDVRAALPGGAGRAGGAGWAGGVGGAGGAGGAGDLLLLLSKYDATVQALLTQYLSYLTTMSETESMPRSVLQAEWAFTARLAKRIKCAASLAPIAFSDITCNQLKRLLNEFNQEFGKLIIEDNDQSDPNKETVYAICRSIQSIYAWSRDAALQTAQWARALAARLARAPPPSYVQQRGEMFDCLMAIRDSIAKHIDFVLERSKTAPKDELPRELLEALTTRVRELLLQIYKLGFELHKEIYKFVHGSHLSEERSVRRSRPVSLQPMRAPFVERRKRPETMLIHESFNPMIHKEVHRFVNDAHGRGAQARRSVTSPSGRRTKFVRTDSIVEDYETNVFDERLFDGREGQTNTSIELLLSGDQSSRNGEEEEVELRNPHRRISCEEKRWSSRVARAVIQFAKCWMQFVLERCDRGRGLRPRWASQGLEFLMLACDPCNTKHLSEEEFEELKQLMDGCISHVVGSRPSPKTPEYPATPLSPRPKTRLTPSPIPNNYVNKDAPQPPSPPSEPESLLVYPEAESMAHRRRVLEAIERVDRARDRRLRSSKSVGAVLAAAVASYEPKLRQLSFKWQRGLKIGAGTFGKVYTVVNTESGQLLAMKELSIAAGDRRALQRAANELRVLEGVIHPHLVRYYGCELHREEMLIFMELCVEGSLEALVATSGALAEHTVRRYTKQLLSAVHELHAKGIAHRDIKSGNIFLTNEGHCLKLGDFGCAVKIRAHSTAPGELQGFVGTQAYMAPEVFMKSSGHGRAADIWSLGCVATEMASGKRPFSEYDSNYQIMFVVGMGGRPEIPSTLSEEGQQFCLSCLTHDADQRPTAEALTFHHFLMVKSDDDCKCEPAYLIT